MKMKRQKNNSDEPSNITLNNTEYFKSTDLGLSGTLLTLNFELVTLDISNPKRAVFIFKRRNGIDKVVTDFFSGKLKVSARGLLNSVKALKNLLYSSL